MEVQGSCRCGAVRFRALSHTPYPAVDLRAAAAELLRLAPQHPASAAAAARADLALGSTGAASRAAALYRRTLEQGQLLNSRFWAALGGTHMLLAALLHSELVTPAQLQQLLQISKLHANCSAAAAMTCQHSCCSQLRRQRPRSSACWCQAEALASSSLFMISRG